MSSSPSTSKLSLWGAGDSRFLGEKWPVALGLFLLLLGSVALLWVLTDQNILLVGGYGVGALFTLIILRLLRGRPDVAPAVNILPPDWSVTRAVANDRASAIAICDRAGRLICANDKYGNWLGGLNAPPQIGDDKSVQEKLAYIGRTAWREGRAHEDALNFGNHIFNVSAVRSGSADDYLVWNFEPKQKTSLMTLSNEMAAGPIGILLSEAGIMAASIGSGGRIRAANGAFTLRATGDATTNIVNIDIATLLSTDEKGRIFFTHDGPRGLTVRLSHMPYDKQQPDGASLILLLDEDSVVAERQAALTHVENLLSTLPLGLAMVDRDGRFIFANNSFIRASQIGERNLPPYPSDLVIAEDKGAVADTIRRFAHGQPQSGDLAIRLRGQSDEVTSLSIAGVRGLGEAAVLLGIKDGSEEVRLKRQVAQATKMQAVGQLAGGVAHDFNNILTAIIGYCDLMLMRHPPGDSDYDDIQQIKNNSNRAASLTRQLLAFSRQQTLRPQILQLPDIVSEVSALLKRLLGEKVELAVRHGRQIGSVRADPGQLEQVIVNLVVNARDAMPNGGTVNIETRAVSVDEVRRMSSDILPLGKYSLLSVIDGGKGIKPQDLGKIFEPFFTTKEVGKGTGLGLSTVYGIVKQSGGYIFADSQLGQGTRFDIYFPVHADAQPIAEQKKIAPKVEATKDLWGSENLLLVEDEDMVRAVAERALARQGYKVDVARDGEEALELLATGKKYDLIVSDVVMPNMDGPTMAKIAREKYGNIRLLFMSGYAEEQLRDSIGLDDVSFLPKPFSVQQISEAVQNALKKDI
ncbi:hybrid sensor histidine kinase/response regulator [Sphingorhabdus lutea]|uniref:histidine kinase n=1 Tax=Sphingorhabdus lutea TaxID=1913578 RepID=A0A1L3JCI2_9SPHN|nr:ATP-binding protein [Sphingorhabdus lutea]APG62838.1 hybrid sensor histidine kinase/response regulator [Sphingorhabdus lutea]